MQQRNCVSPSISFPLSMIPSHLADIACILLQGENGIACSLTSPGHKALAAATHAVHGHVSPYSISGSLPLVRDLQEHGYDIQLCGFGQSSKYHATNESASLDGFVKAAKIITKVRMVYCIFLFVLLNVVFHTYCRLFWRSRRTKSPWSRRIPP